MLKKPTSIKKESALLMKINAGTFTQAEELEEQALKPLKKIIVETMKMSSRVYKRHKENQYRPT